MNEFDYEALEGVGSAYLFEDLYDTIIRLCFVEKEGLLMDTESEMLEAMVSTIGDYNPDWMDVVLPPVEDDDDCFSDGFSNPEDDPREGAD